MTIPNNFTQLQIPLARQAPNFAPRKPLEKLLQDKKPSKQPTKFEASFKKWYDTKMAYKESAWKEIYSTAQLTALFREGQQLLVRRPYGVGWYVRPIQNDDTYRQLAMNLMGFHAQVCESKIVASNPTVNMRAGDDTPQSIAAAQACRPVVDYYETEWYTSKFTRREAIALLTQGMFIHRVRWNPFKGGLSVQEREVGETQGRQTDGGYGECLDCPYTSEAADFEGGACPECGTNAVDVKPPTKSNLIPIRMGQSRPVGEPEILQTPLFGWRWDLAKDLEDSPWAIYRQRVTPGVLSLMIGDVIIPDSRSSDDRGLEALETLNYAGQSFEGVSWAGSYGTDRTNDIRSTMAECWIPPEDQAEILLDEGETICGQTVPAGRMSDFFKGPVCVVTVNDGAAIFGTFGQDTHQTQVCTGQWIMQSESGAGRGMEDTVAVQRRFNAVDGQIYQGMATTATPAVLTDMRLLKEEQSGYLFRPGQNIDINLSLLPPNMKLADAFYLGQPGNISQQYIQYGSQFLRQMFQLSAFVTEFTDGLIGVDNRTATGAQITAALANSLYGPMLATKGQARVRIAQMIAALEVAHNVSSRYFPGKDNARGRMVSGKDLKGKVVFELVQNSELPTTPFSQQTDIRVMVESLGGPQGIILLKQQEPEMFEQLAAPFNYKPEVDAVDQVSTLCLERLEQMKGNLQAGVVDPAMLVERLQPPVSRFEPKHQEKQLWWSRFLDLQQGQEAPLELRQAAEGMWSLHEKYRTDKKVIEQTNEGMAAGMGQMAMQAPTALGAAALQSQQPQPAVEDKSAEIESKILMQQSEEQNDLRLKKMESDTQKDVVQIQSDTQLEAVRLQGKNQVAAAKARPRPTVKKSAA